MDPATLSLLMTVSSQGMRMYADYMEQAAAGSYTDDQVNAIVAHLQTHVDAFQALVNAHKAP